MSFSDLEEVSHLASQLQHYIDSTVLSVPELVSLVKERKVDQFRSVFISHEQRYQAERMFYIYINGRIETTPSVVYEDKVKFVCRSRSGYNESSGTYYHAVWAVGISEGQVWIHRLGPWDSHFEDGKFEWTEDYIKQKMGFKHELVEGQPIQFVKDEPVHVQGDLILTLRFSFEEFIEFHRKHAKQMYEREYDRRIENQIWDAPYIALKANRIKEACEKDVKFLTQLMKKEMKELMDGHPHNPYSRTDADKKRVEVIRERHNIPKREARLTSELINRIEHVRKNIHQRLVDEQTHSQEYIDKRASEVERRLSDWNIDRWIAGIMLGRVVVTGASGRRTENEVPQRIQINRRMGNHLVIIESGAIMQQQDNTRAEQPLYVLPSPTTAYFIHDEHMNSSVKLPSGVYELGLLIRHRQDRR